ncbi:MdtP family multidrug efflux transporter outer membrane subunit [Klebsiella aerogenes]|uniref:MdtP family multidrug efflux transporter outer membrane subunit n=1 Tax=Klebsiella aerogenes TaxID=548 RepID=UPI001BD06083|nr:MdtP family multidrug efflux transporter outer membrane subunit [Klebsiella aerogenes]HCR0136142.1 MdtP family multidrug efflux transporter outer membrane subunit [Klebsiella aerogenes]
MIKIDAAARFLRYSPLAFVISLLTGCALIQDDPGEVPIVNPQQAQLAQVIHLANSGWPAARWWEGYHDPQLNMLVNRALQNSPTMQAARLRISQSQSTVELAQSAMGVQATAVAAQNRMRITDKSFSWPYSYSLPVDKNGPWYTLNTVGVGATLNIDLWGADRARVAAAIGEKNARQAETAGIELDLASSVAQLYFAMQATFQKIVLLQQLEEIARLSVQAHEHRTQRGVEDSVDIANAQAELLGAQQQVITARGTLTQYRETLRALIGADAQSMPEIHPVALPALQETLPDSLSFELLARRPDLQALRGYVTASMSQVDAAKAAFYPHFDIKAFWGYNALSVGDLFKSSFQQINLLPGLYLPIFDGGRLNANLKSVRTASNILIKQYNQAVLDAVRDVAISSSQLNDLNQQVALQELKVTAAMATTRSASAHHQRGLLSRYAAQEARRPAIAQQLLLLDIQAQRLSTDITLIKALGGDYRGPAVGSAKP